MSESTANQSVPITEPLHAQRGSMRDQRIDFARGIALIMIVMNHTVPPPIIFENFGHPQLGHVFAFAGADVFVYLSGYVCGIAYGKTLIERGFLATQTRALKRCVQIYIAAMIAFVVTWIAMKLFQQLGPYNVLDQLKFDTDFSFTSIGFLKSLLLIGPYTHFGILLFYIFLLLLLPTMLWLYERARPIAIAFSVGLWLLAQYAFFKKQEWIHLFDGAFGNILAWQLLFFMGMFIARDRKWLSSATGRFGTLICILILCLDSYMGQMKWMYFHFDKKEELGILRIVELLAAVVLVTRLVPPQASFFSTGWGARVRRLGSRSLTIFAATLPTCYIFTHLAAWVESKYGHSSHRLDVGRAGYLVLLGAHLLLILGFDSIMEMVERRKQRK